jgi:hypothetical protein
LPKGSVKGDLQGVPGQQTATLPKGSKRRAEEGEHVLGRETFEVFDVAALDVFDKHGGRGLADAAADAREIRLSYQPFVVDGQLDAHYVTANRVAHFMRVRCARGASAMVRLLAMVKDSVAGDGRGSCCPSAGQARSHHL